ncbi:hypothetical protein ACP70R_011157 [Stipagrostis hirtigluma subsp. patula]
MATLRRLLRCLGARRHWRLLPCRDGRRGKDGAKKSFLRATRPSGGARFARTADVEQLETPPPRRCRWLRLRLRGMNRVFARSPTCGGTTAVAAGGEVVIPTAAVQAHEEAHDTARVVEFPREHAAAATIQACFRGHLARRAFRALRSVVKLQAFARGAYVRKQANVAIRCMKVLVRLQVRVRARQLCMRDTAKVQ